MGLPSKTAPRARKSLSALATGRDRFAAFQREVPVEGEINYLVIEALMAATSLSRAHVRRLAARFQKERTPETLAPAFKGPKPGTSRQPPELQAAVKQLIAKVYLTKGVRPAAAAAARQIRLLLLGEAKAKGWQSADVPSERTLIRTIGQISYADLARVTAPSLRTLYEYSDIGRASNGPLDVVQMDHTRGNVFLVDSSDRTPIGRPWVTFLICVYSRCIVGHLVSMQAPSILRCGRAVVNAILPKEPLMKRLGLGHLPYPMHGIFKQFDHDGESAHKNLRFLSACRMAGIGDPNARPFLGPATYGAHIERLIGTMLGEFRFLDGATGANPQDRIDYDPQADATMTIEEFERWLLLQIVQYHHRGHRSLGKAPLQAWRDGGGERVQAYLGDHDELFKRFLPGVLRTVRTSGVQFLNSYYRHPALADLQGKRLFAHSDPYNLNELHLDVPDGFLTLHRRDTLDRCYEFEHEAWLRRIEEQNQRFYEEEALPTLITTSVESQSLIEQSRRLTKARQKAGEGLSRMDELKPTVHPSLPPTSTKSFPSLDEIPILEIWK